jgi:hypothetical protein
VRLSSSVLTFNAASGSWTTSSISLGEIDGAPLPPCSSGACSDANPCITGACNLELGCEYVSNSDPCEDGDLCTIDDVCSAGICIPGDALTCDDAKLCTDDSCDSGIGCVFTNNSAACDDGNVCSDGDVCSGGVCTPGGPLDCDDGDPCTAEACDQIEGCSHTPIFGCNPAEVPAAGSGLTGLLGLLLASLGVCRLRCRPDA